MELGNHQDFVSGNPCLDGTNYLYAWARNAATVSLPEGVAFEIGKDTKIQSLVLQVHYADVTSFKSMYVQYEQFIRCVCIFSNVL